MLEFNIKNVELHREEKIQSLLIGKLAQEKAIFDELLTKFEFSREECSLIEKAYDFALSQKYGDHILLKHYFSHPLRVSIYIMDWMLRNNENNSSFIIAALIHNVIEKKILSPREIELYYGNEISSIITILTIDRENEKKSGWLQNYYEKLNNHGKMSMMLKAFDKFDNIYAIVLNPSYEVRNSYINEIEMFILPIFIKFDKNIVEYFKALIISSRNTEHILINQWIMEQK